MFIVTAALLILFSHAAIAALAAHWQRKIPINKLAHAIMKINYCAARRKEI
jgi:hypothetical protein